MPALRCISTVVRLQIDGIVNRAAEGGRGSRTAFGFLNRAAVGWAVSRSSFGLFNFFSFIGDYIETSTDDVPRMMSSSANYRPFFSSFRHIPPQEHFVKLANYYSDRTRPCVRNVYLIKIGPKSHGHTRRDICVETGPRMSRGFLHVSYPSRIEL